VVAQDRCRDDWQEQKVQDIRDQMFCQTRFASAQGDLIPWSERQWLVVYRPKRARRKVQLPLLAQQVPLFAFVSTS
jgi:hypothetical protein